MKTYYEILEEIKEASAELVKVSEEIRKKDSRFNSMNLEEMISYCKTPEYKEESARRKLKLAILRGREEELKMTLAFLKNNLKQSLYAEILPVIIETMHKYKGKALGDKTKDKIYNEVKDRVNCGIYIHANDITIYDKRSNYLENTIIYLNHKDGNKDKFLVDNKIQTFEEEDVIFGYVKDYIDDIPKMVDYLRIKNRKIYQLAEELKADIDNYNSYVPNGIPYVEYNLYNIRDRIF